MFSSHPGQVLTVVPSVTCAFSCSMNAMTEPGITEDQSLYFVSLSIGLRCNERETLSESQHRVNWKCLGSLCGVISLKGQKAMSRSCASVSAGKGNCSCICWGSMQQTEGFHLQFRAAGFGSFHVARVTRRAGLESPGLQFESGTSGHRRMEAASGRDWRRSW